MAINSLIHSNEYGLPLNDISWLETHHRSKAVERRQMIKDLQLDPGIFVVDAGCGPGLWIPLLAQAIGPKGRIMGVDISTEALVTAQQRCASKWYRNQVQFKCSTLKQLPIRPDSAHFLFSANVSQYLPDPVSTFAAMGKYLRPGGRMAIKDIDYGMMRFGGVDPILQAKVFQAREHWEQVRVKHGFTFEDSWVGSKLAGYLREAGFEDIQEKSYKIVRQTPLSKDYRSYVRGIAEWFVCEDTPFLSPDDVIIWLQCFLDHPSSALNQETFISEETEFVVTGVWNKSASKQKRFFQIECTLPQ